MNCSEEFNDLELENFDHFMIQEKAISRYFHVLTPELLLYEIINTFKYRTEIDAALLEEILKELFHILIFIKLDSKDYINAYEISKKTNNSIYDSIYIAISEKYKAPFITADKKLYEALKLHNYNIVLLDDFISS